MNLSKISIMTSSRLLLTTILCSSFIFTPSAQAGKLVIADQTQLEGLIPSYLINREGFDMPAGKKLMINGYEFNPNQRIFPMYSMYKSFAKGKSFVGVKIPSKHLSHIDGEDDCVPDQNLHFYRDPVSMRRILSRSRPLAAEAMNQIERIKLPNGHEMMAHYYQCDVYGISTEYDVQSHNNFDTGATIPLFWSNGNKTIVLGKDNSFGFHLNIGPSSTYIGGKKGFNLASTYNSIFDGVDMLQNADSAEDLMLTGMSLAPFIMASLAQNAADEANRANEQLYTNMRGMPADNNWAYELPAYTAPSLQKKVPAAAFSKELQKKFKDLKSKLKRETKWRNELSKYTENEVVLLDDDGNKLLQQMCDYLANIYDMPKDIWPRCRIAATWEPNAWAFPGGEIFFTAGLIGIMSDLDSLLLVLGHEIGHVIARHTTRTMPLKNAVIYSSVGLGVAANLGLATFSLSGGLGYMGDVSLASWFFQANGGAIAGGLALGYALQAMFFAPVAAIMARSRQMEWEADRFGQQAALLGGAKNEKIYQGWGEFRDFIAKNMNIKDTTIRKIMASHPDSGARLKAIEDRFESGFKDNSINYNNANRLSDDFYTRYTQLHTKLKPGADAWGEKIRRRLEANKFSNEHLSAEHSVNTLLSPAGSCVHFAVGAYSENQ
jgi:Zn-dependent protease with chaperone function